MKKINQLLFITCLFLVSCGDDIPIPDTYIFQVETRQGVIVPVEVMDYNDGLGTLKAQLLFDNQETVFDAQFDYVSEVKTNFSLEPADDQITAGNTIGSGYYTNDSIRITIVQRIGGRNIEESYRGGR